MLLRAPKAPRSDIVDLQIVDVQTFFPVFSLFGVSSLEVPLTVVCVYVHIMVAV